MAVLEEKTVVDQVELRKDGIVRIRLFTQTYRDGVPKGDYEIHRIELGPEHDVEATLQLVQINLPQIGKPAMEEEELQEIREAVDYHRGKHHARLQAAAISDKQGGKGPVV